ncbi:hypothetical protein A2976_02395 [candidate division WWE3 bacterium RIFCSPLOWO2_01_FULL_41_9]|uniref:Uncharacterized protein n=1 Tax=candidate division WWE3 bacterium RIFCSPLOWO2_01_FULL_41_9 TaxID=1802626 RepID=A0A1F4VLM3_UNCKA|nr:MAG: hypothetical protein A2976_02395 [candidate division WWE3 bacterium RIFCSPLOWO2_01_FULL_41_9]
MSNKSKKVKQAGVTRIVDFPPVHGNSISIYQYRNYLSRIEGANYGDHEVWRDGVGLRPSDYLHRGDVVILKPPKKKKGR